MEAKLVSGGVRDLEELSDLMVEIEKSCYLHAFEDLRPIL